MYASGCNSFFSGMCYCLFTFDFQTMTVNIRWQRSSLNVLYLLPFHFSHHSFILFSQQWKWLSSKKKLCSSFYEIILKSMQHCVISFTLSHTRAHTHGTPYHIFTPVCYKNIENFTKENLYKCTNIYSLNKSENCLKSIICANIWQFHCKYIWFPQNYYCIVVTSFQVILVRWNEPYQKLATCDAQGVIFVWIKHEGRWSVELINDRNSQVITHEINTVQERSSKKKFNNLKGLSIKADAS